MLWIRQRFGYWLVFFRSDTGLGLVFLPFGLGFVGFFHSDIGFILVFQPFGQDLGGFLQLDIGLGLVFRLSAFWIWIGFFDQILDLFLVFIEIISFVQYVKEKRS